MTTYANKYEKDQRVQAFLLIDETHFLLIDDTYKLEIQDASSGTEYTNKYN